MYLYIYDIHVYALATGPGAAAGPVAAPPLLLGRLGVAVLA